MSSSSNTSSTPVEAAPRDFHYKYTVQKGLFMQSEDETDDEKFDFAKKKQNFGLIPRSYPTDTNTTELQWKRFENYIRSLEATKQPNESFKVLFLGRHGEGWHNVAEAKYGTKAWDCYYSALDGADGLTWADAHLTPTGEQQATDVSALWAAQLSKGIPVPETFYVSPLTRTIQTADLTFSTLSFPPHTHSPSQSHSPLYTPLIKELLREALGVHTCDRRSTMTHLRAHYPHLTFEPGFSDPDPLWQADYREPASARRYRLAVFLDALVAADEGVVLSFTSHSGAIGSLLEVVGHRKFRLETGGVIPVVVKAERVEGSREVPPWEPSDSPPMCEKPPVGL